MILRTTKQLLYKELKYDNTDFKARISQHIS